MIFVSEVFVVAGASSLAADGWTGGLPGEGHRRWSRAREDGPLCVAKSLGERGKRDSQVRDRGCDAAWRSGQWNGRSTLMATS